MLPDHDTLKVMLIDYLRQQVLNAPDSSEWPRELKAFISTTAVNPRCPPVPCPREKTPSEIVKDQLLEVLTTQGDSDAIIKAIDESRQRITAAIVKGAKPKEGAKPTHPVS